MCGEPTGVAALTPGSYVTGVTVWAPITGGRNVIWDDTRALHINIARPAGDGETESGWWLAK